MSGIRSPTGIEVFGVKQASDPASHFALFDSQDIPRIWSSMVG